MNSKKIIVVLGILGGVIALIILMCNMFLHSISGEFKQYLSQKYPNESFKVGLAKIEPFYGRYIAEVTIPNNQTVFEIAKTWETNEIEEDFRLKANIEKSNSWIKEVFKGINNSLNSVSGSGGTTGNFKRIDLDLKYGVDPLSTTRKALDALRNNNITPEIVIVRYEDYMHVYEMHLTPGDYSLTEDELKSKVINIK